MSWFTKKPEIEDNLPVRTDTIKHRWGMDVTVWESLTDAQLADAWGNADSVWNERTQALSIVCAERLKKKYGKKREILANTCFPLIHTFTAGQSIERGMPVYTESKQTITKKRKLRK